MSKELYYSGKAREAMLAGVNCLADAVKVTLGPKRSGSFRGQRKVLLIQICRSVVQQWQR